jgi:hypothetical protein
VRLALALAGLLVVPPVLAVLCCDTRNAACTRPTYRRRLSVQAVRCGLEQRGHEEALDNAVEAIVVVEEQPVVAILTRQSHARGDGIGVNVYLIVASRVAPNLIGAQMMGVLRSTAFGPDPRRDRFAGIPVVVRVRGGRKEGKPSSERDDRAIHGLRLDRLLRTVRRRVSRIFDFGRDCHENLASAEGLAIGRNGIARTGTVARANSASADVNKNFRMIHFFGRVRVFKVIAFLDSVFSNSHKMSHSHIGFAAD